MNLKIKTLEISEVLIFSYLLTPEGTVRIYTHGNKDRILDPNGHKILTAERFDEVLMERSHTWRNYRENGGSIKIELMSCNTGRMGNGFASMTSKAFRFSSVLAPNNYYVAYTRNGVSWGAVAGQYTLINPGRWNNPRCRGYRCRGFVIRARKTCHK